MTDRHPIKLGNKVKSSIYNIEGIAAGFYHHSSHRVPQVSVQPISTDGIKITDAQFIDFNLLDYVDEGCVDRLIPLVYNPFNYGDKVRDKISGFSGVVTAWFEIMNGCIDIQISPSNLDKDGRMIKFMLCEISRVEKITETKNLDESVENSRQSNLYQDTHTTDPAKHSVSRTGLAIHRGEDLIRR